MEQQFRFAEVDGHRVAHASLGEGPLLVMGGPWVTHLEDEWSDPRARALYEELAQAHRVVRYDRPGTGLSDRVLPGLPTVELEARALEAVIDAYGDEPAIIFACSCAGLAALRLASTRPERVSKLVLAGAWAARDDIPQATRRSLVDFTKTNWPLAAQMLSGLFHPEGSGDEIAQLTRGQLRAASGDVAAAYLDLDLRSDVRDLLPGIEAPTLVVHRRGDRTSPIARGRELAALLPNARFVPLAGAAHLPWLDERRDLRRALAGFLGDATPVGANGDSPLTRRELEVLRLVGSGLSNKEIAASLVLSEHTVHRHVANILRKLAQSSRAAAAAQAARSGLI